ncbi:hypothetical protein [Flyfo myovirus Tbat2_7]|nr:hypothetical protein [Flyfo myovirus Tbat2_7]
MKLDENTTKIIIAVVPAVLIFIVDRLKNKNSSEGIYADHSQELLNTVEKLLKERQEWQDERIELKRQIGELNSKIDLLLANQEQEKGENNE